MPEKQATKELNDVILISEEMIYSEAYQDLKVNAFKLMPIIILESNKSERFEILYKTFILPPFNMHNQSITRGIDSLLLHGFIEMVTCGYSGKSSEFILSNEWKSWTPGDIMFSRKEVRKNSHNAGHIYIIKKDSGMIKIGISVNPKKRIQEIETMNGERFLKTWISEKCSCFTQIEIDMHNYYDKFRIVGEWFKIDFDEAIKYCIDNIVSHTKKVL